MEQENYTMLLFGASGSGKSTSLRNLPLEKVSFINCEGKTLPFSSKKLHRAHSTKKYTRS